MAFFNPNDVNRKSKACRADFQNRIGGNSSRMHSRPNAQIIATISAQKEHSGWIALRNESRISVYHIQTQILTCQHCIQALKGPNEVFVALVIHP